MLWGSSVDDEPTFAKVAEAIVSGTAFEVEPVRKALEWASTLYKPNRKLTGRAEIRRRLERVQKATREVQLAVRDFPIETIPDLEAYFADLGDLLVAVRNMSERADRALAPIPKKGGKSLNKHHTICAMIIIVNWSLVHGKRPGITNRVQGIVEDYWVACGGSRSAAGDVQRWKQPIARALRVKPAKSSAFLDNLASQFTASTLGK
jgi:hypothetical protein